MSSGAGARIGVGGNSDGLIDREKVTPSLLRVFWKEHGHNSDLDYGRDGKQLPGRQLHFYTWPDATLKELSQLLKDVVPCARRRGSRMEFSLVYPGPEGRTRMRMVGSVRNSGRSPEDAKTLRDCKYQIGDHLDIAVMDEGGAGGGLRGYGGGGGEGEGGTAMGVMA
ncbi:histone deacetylase complex subunit sap18 [Nannochloropsis gaditana]|uniref:Histone deacetylase complex subunit sap18 n=1 Tax=Nannochloropsis gaditana TaxID=72520 RepID=W7T8H9_9STRA|nr:histone deacetylase complex subunit sap18 [Nannochloropsis gaditana]